MGARRRTLPDDDVELVVLQRRVEQFLQRRLQAVHFVNEQDLLFAQVGEDGRQVALDLQRRAGSLLESHAQFIGDDGRQRCLAQPRRPIEQDMVQRFAARTGRLDGDRQIFFDLCLADEFAQVARTQLELIRRIVFGLHGRDQSVFIFF